MTDTKKTTTPPEQPPPEVTATLFVQEDDDAFSCTHALVQVERWMAIIREFNQEQHFSVLDRRLSEMISANGSDLDRLEGRLRETILKNGSDAEIYIRRAL